MDEDNRVYVPDNPTAEASKAIRQATMQLRELRQVCVERSKHYRELAEFYEHEVALIDDFHPSIARDDELKAMAKEDLDRMRSERR